MYAARLQYLIASAVKRFAVRRLGAKQGAVARHLSMVTHLGIFSKKLEELRCARVETTPGGTLGASTVWRCGRFAPACLQRRPDRASGGPADVPVPDPD